MSIGSEELSSVLPQVLKHLLAHPYSHVPNPEGPRTRSSVAVIIRIRPAFTPSDPPNASMVHLQQDESPENLVDFFAQPWVQTGDPEVLLIKRASRRGDRWAGHVALPGGKRDPDDDSDMAVAVRETREEVGLDLSGGDCLPAGNLPERVVMAWGWKPLMVLCPFIFVLTGKDVPRLRPQPTEVASAHWVPLRALLSPNLRTREYVDTASRMARHAGPLVQSALTLLVGRMVFSAVQLLPSESIYSSEIEGFLPARPESAWMEFAMSALPLPREAGRHRLALQQPLLLWGLTLGVMADLLDMLPPYNAVKLWRYPSFTPPDLRLLVWILTRSLRRRNANHLSDGTLPYEKRRRPSQTALDATTEARAVTEAEPMSVRHTVSIGGLGAGANSRRAFGGLQDSYYKRVDKAIAIFVLYRATLGCSIAYWAFKAWRRRNQS